MTTRRPYDAMPGNPAGNQDSRNASFDQAARARYASALEHLSPAVRVRLQQARQTASQTAPKPDRRPVAWAWVGSAAVLSLIVGLQLRHAPAGHQPAAPLTVRSMDNQPAPAIDDEVAGMLAALDENPDFYLWLAANDSALPPPSER
ncbi:MAG TPA: hypothetical protein VFS82_06220 [Lysobacter sp.]|nr:hypothetical protein [Lysobacter sp.]